MPSRLRPAAAVRPQSWSCLDIENTHVLRIVEAPRRSGVPKTLSGTHFLCEITPPVGGVISPKSLITPPARPAATVRREEAWGNRHAPMAAVRNGDRHILEIIPPGGPRKTRFSRKADAHIRAHEAGNIGFPKVLRGVISPPGAFRFNQTLIV